MPVNERSRDCFHSGNEESRHPVLICVPTPMLVLTVMLMSGLMWPLREVQCSAQSGVPHCALVSTSTPATVTSCHLSLLGFVLVLLCLY